MGKTPIRNYEELVTFRTFEDRYNYLKIEGSIGIETFGFDRYLNQALYKSGEWKELRNRIIIRDTFRDDVCDLGVPDIPIVGRVIVHHMNPLTEEDILDRNPDIFNPNFLICVSIDTHNAIHYGDFQKIKKAEVARSKNDTCPWK